MDLGCRTWTASPPPRRSAGSAGVAVLVLTMSDDDDTVFAAMRAGARGYLVKGATKEEILRAIRAVAGRRSSARLAPAAVLQRLSSSSSPGARELTPREREVLDLACGGACEPAIAARWDCPQDRQQQHLGDLHQARGGRTYGGDRAAARRWSGPPLVRSGYNTPGPQVRMGCLCRVCLRAVSPPWIRVLISGVWVRSTQAGGIHSGRPSPLIRQCPAAAGEVVMVIPAQQGQIVQVRFATINPFDDVVAFAPLGCAVAAGEGAAAVAGGQCQGLSV